jgi:hypothetical protein
MSSDGMGRDSHGPDFAPPDPGWHRGTPAATRTSGPFTPSGPSSDPHSRPPTQPSGFEPPRPPKSRLPTVITAAVIGVVALIVVIGTVLANRQDLQPTSPERRPATPVPSALPSTSSDSITFSSREGSGRLTVADHRWTSEGAIEPRHGEYLQLKLEITATDGMVSYGPEYFQSFDEIGDLYQTTEAGARQPALSSGVLRPGDTVTGWIAFDLPHGPVTLLMSNALLESVTALRITD